MKLNKKQERKIARILAKELIQKGYLVHEHYAKTTKSIYLKLDYGACCGIRISDHNGKKKYRYKFNLIKQYNGPKVINDRGYIRLFYNYKNIKELLNDVDFEKKQKINKYGLLKYRMYMKINSNQDIYKSFRKVG